MKTKSYIPYKQDLSYLKVKVKVIYSYLFALLGHLDKS